MRTLVDQIELRDDGKSVWLLKHIERDEGHV